MQIIITTDKEAVTSVEFKDVDEAVTYDTLVAILLSLLENFTVQFVNETKIEKEGEEYLYDMLDTLFFKFMERTFPDIQPRDFDLSDAGLLYAQDKIIAEAEKKGISFDEALKKYEDKAKKYVKEKSGLQSHAR